MYQFRDPVHGFIDVSEDELIFCIILELHNHSVKL